MSASTLAIRTSSKRSMTVIAAFSVSNFPVLFGDLLLTGPSVSERRVAVPAQGEVQDFFGIQAGRSWVSPRRYAFSEMTAR